MWHNEPVIVLDLFVKWCEEAFEEANSEVTTDMEPFHQADLTFRVLLLLRAKFSGMNCNHWDYLTANKLSWCRSYRLHHNQNAVDRLQRKLLTVVMLEAVANEYCPARRTGKKDWLKYDLSTNARNVRNQTMEIEAGKRTEVLHSYYYRKFFPRPDELGIQFSDYADAANRLN